MKITLKQIAERTGVSVNTVSLALRGMPSISEQTSARIRQAAKELGYVPRTKEPVPRRNLCIVSTGIHLHDSYFYMAFHRLFIHYASAHGYHMMILEAEYFQDEPARVRERLDAASVGGILTLGDMTEGAFADIRRCGIPVVAVGARYYHNAVCTFIEDNLLAAQQAVQHLLENGYRRIGFAGSPLHSAAFSERYFGFRQACYRAGLDCLESDHWLDLLPEHGLEDNIATICARLDTGAALPEAFFCANDFLAMAMLRALTQRGYRVPEQIALIGVDHNPMGQALSPRLTTIDVCCSQQAEASVRHLIGCVESGQETIERILIPTILRPGESVLNRRH